MKKIFFSAAMLTAAFANAQNTGIGTTNPQQKLDVVGNQRLTGDIMLQAPSSSTDSGDLIFQNVPTAPTPGKVVGRLWSVVSGSGLNLAGHDSTVSPFTIDTPLGQPERNRVYFWRYYYYDDEFARPDYMQIMKTGEVALYNVAQNDASTNVLVYGTDGKIGRKPISALSTAYTSSISNILNGTTFERAALTGDVTAAQNSNATTIAANAVTSAKIADGTIAAADLSAMGATQVNTGAQNALYQNLICNATTDFTLPSGQEVAIPGFTPVTVPNTGKYLIIFHSFFQNPGATGTKPFYVNTYINGVLYKTEETYAYVESGYYFNTHYPVVMPVTSANAQIEIRITAKIGGDQIISASPLVGSYRNNADIIYLGN